MYSADLTMPLDLPLRRRSGLARTGASSSSSSTSIGCKPSRFFALDLLFFGFGSCSVVQQSVSWNASRNGRKAAAHLLGALLLRRLVHFPSVVARLARELGLVAALDLGRLALLAAGAAPALLAVVVVVLVRPRLAQRRPLLGLLAHALALLGERLGLPLDLREALALELVEPLLLGLARAPRLLELARLGRLVRLLRLQQARESTLERARVRAALARDVLRVGRRLDRVVCELVEQAA